MNQRQTLRILALYLYIVSFMSLLSPYAYTETLFTATYKGRYEGLGITLQRKLEHLGGNHYTLSSHANNFLGNINEKSTFIIKQNKLVPLNYHYQRKILGRKSIQQLIFDWDTNTVNYFRSDKSEKNTQNTLLANTLDPTLYQFKLQHELAAGKSAFRLTFAKERKIKTFDFKIKRNGLFKYKNKALPSIEIERVNQPDKSLTNITLIPELNYQIAQINHQDKDGSKYKITLSNYNGDKHKIAAFYKSIHLNEIEEL